MGLPIVFIHSSNSSYLSLTLTHIKTFNGHNPIYLIGDEATKHYGSYLTHVDLKTVSGRAAELAPIYKHFSTNNHQYELFCLQRWFVLWEFMEKYGLEECLYLDSDILMFSPAEEAQQRSRPFDLACLIFSPHTNFINKREALGKFCTWLKGHYEGPDSDERLAYLLAEHRERVHKTLGGISDMTYHYHFRLNFPDIMGNLTPVKEGTHFDQTIDFAENFEMEGGIKKIEWRNNQPYGYHKELKEWIRFHTLHFQGKSKEHLAKFVHPLPPNHGWNQFYLNTIFKLQKVKKKIFGR